MKNLVAAKNSNFNKNLNQMLPERALNILSVRTAYMCLRYLSKRINFHVRKQGKGPPSLPPKLVTCIHPRKIIRCRVQYVYNAFCRALPFRQRQIVNKTKAGVLMLHVHCCGWMGGGVVTTHSSLPNPPPHPATPLAPHYPNSERN